VGSLPLILELDATSPNNSLCTSIFGKFETEEAFPSDYPVTDPDFRIERILIPARSTNSFSKEMKYVDEKHTDSEVQRIKSVEPDNRRRFIASSWAVDVAKCPLCQIEACLNSRLFQCENRTD